MPPFRREQRRAAFEHFVAEATDGLLRTAYLLTGDAGEAEDAVQECLFKIARRWSRVVTMDSPKAYARRILVNLTLDGSRHRARHRAELETGTRSDEPLPRESGVSSGVFAGVDERIDLIRAVGELPPRQRAALVLRYFDDLTEGETAAVLGCSVGTVKSTTSRALEKMRDLVPPTDRWPEPAHDVQLVECERERR
jgi:RNA polymerase sigma-70 factor (sigma-E family)